MIFFKGKKKNLDGFIIHQNALTYELIHGDINKGSFL